MTQTLIFRALIAAIVFFSFGAQAKEFLAQGVGSFVFQPTGYFSAKPIVVHYYVPSVSPDKSKVLFALHGVQRNGRNARSHWLPVAEQQGITVLAPEFTQVAYPQASYQLAQLANHPSTEWTFELIEAIFDEVVERQKLKAKSYDVFGHSAGAQFAHRLAILMPTTRARTIIAANAGSYTMPHYGDANEAPFPYTLREDRISKESLTQAFARQLVVMLGDEDTDTQAADLPNSRYARDQGIHRLARGKKFFETAQKQAQTMNASLAWQLVIVPGLGHDSGFASRAAAKILYGYE